MSMVFDVSMVATLILPDEDSSAVAILMASLKGRGPASVPSLFWHEARNVAMMAERRHRIAPGDALSALTRLRQLPLQDVGSGSDHSVLALASAHELTTYDATYLALAKSRDLPLATLDEKLAEAARAEAVTVLGPLARA